MKITKLRSVDAAIRTLDFEDRQKVLAWFTHLENWENDEHTRNISNRTVEKDVYALNTSDDLRIFFKLDVQNQEITIVDIAKPSRFKFAASTSE